MTILCIICPTFGLSFDSVPLFHHALVSPRINMQTRCANKILTMAADSPEKRNENETLTAETLL